MFREGNTECVEKLVKPAKLVMKMGLALQHEPFERRQGLWNEIRENFTQYRSEECGAFLKDLDSHFSSLFDAALLLLAACFTRNREPFEGADSFSPREIEVFEKIEGYTFIDLLSVNDIKKRLARRDQQTVELVMDFHVSAGKWVDEALEDKTIRITIRTYLKKRWDEYKKKLNAAVSGATTEYEWFTGLAAEWEARAKSGQTVINVSGGGTVNVGGTQITGSVLTGSTVESQGGSAGAGNGIKIEGSVLTRSTVQSTIRAAGEETGSGKEEKLVCRNCRSPQVKGSKFCRECGTPLPKFCGQCSAELEPGAKFCPECGNKTSS
jgi:ribosomal protein L40E